MYLKDKDGNKLTDSYKVEKDDELTVVYKDKKDESKSEDKVLPKNESKNPLTADSIIKYVVLLVVSLNIIILIISVLLKRAEKKN